MHRADILFMTAHELIDFLALLSSGVIGALIATPVRAAITVAADRRGVNRRR